MKSIPRNTFFLGLVSFFTDLSSEMIYPLLPLFLTSVLHASVSFVGLIEGIAETTASMLKLTSGWLSDKINKRKALVVFGYTLSSIVRPLVGITTFAWQVLAIRFLDRVGKGVRTSPRDALVADSATANEKGRAFGFQRAMDHAGAVIGPLVAFLILNFIAKDDYRTTFLLAFIPAILAIVVVSFFVKEQKAQRTKESKPIKLSLKPFDKRFKYFLFIVLIFTLGNSSDAFLILKAKETGVPLGMIPIIWVVLHIVKSLSSVPFGIVSDKVGKRKVIIGGWLVYAISYFGFAFANAGYQIWLLFAFYGFFFGATEGVEKAYVADLVKSESLATAYGIYNFTIGIAAFPASLVMGLIWTKFGVIYAFSFGASMALISSFLLFAAQPQQK